MHQQNYSTVLWLSYFGLREYRPTKTLVQFLRLIIYSKTFILSPLDLSLIPLPSYGSTRLTHYSLTLSEYVNPLSRNVGPKGSS